MTNHERHHVTHRVLVHVQVNAAHVAHVKLKTMRHPNVLKYIDGVEVHMSLLHVQNSFDSILKCAVYTWKLITQLSQRLSLEKFYTALFTVKY